MQLQTKRSQAQALGKQALQENDTPSAKKVGLSSATEIIREKLINRNKNTETLTSLDSGAERNLLSVRTVFPFVLFANTLKIDRQKLTVVYNAFFWSSHTTSIRLKEIRNIETNLGPFLGSITITSQHFLNNTQTISHLKRSDVIKAQRLLQGFMIAYEAQIDTDNIDQPVLLDLLDSLGQENR